MDCDLYGFVMNFIMWSVDKFAGNMYYMICFGGTNPGGSQKQASYLKI
jgi:hypothetical protein